MALLSDTFCLGGRKHPSHRVDLTETHIAVQPASNGAAANAKREESAVVTALDDVIGVKLLPDNRSSGAWLHIYSYPRRKSRWGKLDRCRTDRSYFVCSEETQEGNMRIGERWRCAVWSVVRGRRFVPGSLTVPPSRRFLVLINPASGSGNAQKVYERYVLPMFDMAEVERDVITTERAGHVLELLKKMDIEQLKSFSAIVIVSGDGLVYEAFNGLMARKDWEAAIQTPIAAIPGGSGNALVTSILYAAGEPFTPTCAVFAVLRGEIAPIDLATVQSQDKTHYCFLSLTWGLTADVDINSENYRFMGNSRFAVSFLSRLVSYPKYRARLYYLPVDDSISEETGMAGSGDEDKPNAHLLPSLDDSLSEDSGWKCIAGEFITVVGSMLTHLSPTLHIAPSATLDGGVMYVVVTGGNVSRMKVMKVFTNKSCPDDSVEIYAARAFRLEPDLGEQARQSYMVLDGERINYGAVQLQVHKGLGRVLALTTTKERPQE